MRADFYPDLMNSDLWPLDPSERVEIAPLRGAALAEAIYKPAEHAEPAGVYLEAGLVERLLADAADELLKNQLLFRKKFNKAADRQWG